MNLRADEMAVRMCLAKIKEANTFKTWVCRNIPAVSV